MNIEFKDLKLTESEQLYLFSRAVHEYKTTSKSIAQIWFDLLLEELKKSKFTITQEEK